MRCPVGEDDDKEPFRVGDIVTRDGDDRQEVIESDPEWGTITVRCIVAPAEKWIEVGDEESNLARRYGLVRRSLQSR